MVDKSITEALRKTEKFAKIPTRNDVQEHSLEMHLPYLWKRCEETFGARDSAQAKAFPTIVPIMVGSVREVAEKEIGAILAPYLQNPSNAFIVSSDFCHWGSRFDYTAYLPAEGLKGLRNLSRRQAAPKQPSIHESISNLDHLVMNAIESGDHKRYLEMLATTENTVCGRHPIGVMMATLEVLEKDVSQRKKFKFVQYQRSNLVEDPADSSVSYGAAYVQL
jgi:MEMO1 family protein